jgi:hypothetical protein
MVTQYTLLALTVVSGIVTVFHAPATGLEKDADASSGAPEMYGFARYRPTLTFVAAFAESTYMLIDLAVPSAP